MISILSHIILAGLILGLSQAKASQSGGEGSSSPGLRCESAMKPFVVEYVPSGPRDADMHEAKRALIESLAQVYERLGIHMPAFHAIEDMQGGNLVNLVAQNGYPLPTWMDGAGIVRARAGGSGVLEFVPPGGQNTMTVYNRDDLPFYEWAATQFHASAGHVNFSRVTRFDQVKTADLVRDSQRVAEYIHTLKETVHAEEISLWMQYLDSLEYAQDIVSGTVTPPEQLRKPRDHSETNLLPGFRPQYAELRHPRSPTPSILQAVVANLPEELPDWKKHLAREYERMRRYISGAVQTKIMNEGWAMLMEELIPPHLDDPQLRQHFELFHYSMEYCCMTPWVTGTFRGKVTKKNIRSYLANPYWLGREAWRNIRARFNRGLAHENLSLVEQDRRFLAYAQNELIGKMEDKEFLRLGLDDSWIRKHKLSVTKILNDRRQWNHSLPPPLPGELQVPAQHQVVSREPDEIRKNIVNDLKNFAPSFPRPFLTSFNADGKGVVSLEMLDDYGKRYPLDFATIAPTLYVMGQILRKPVSIESTHYDGDIRQLGQPQLDEEFCTWIRDYVKEMEEAGDPQAFIDHYKRHYAQCFASARPDTFIRIRTTVATSGQVTVEVLERAQKPEVDGIEPQWQRGTNWVDVPGVRDPRLTILTRGVAHPVLTERAKRVMDSFIENLHLEDQRLVDRYYERTASEVQAAVTSMGDGFSVDFFDHMPTVAAALAEFHQKLSHRLPKALERALAGKTRVWRRGSKVGVQALPQIPYFKFNRKLIELGEKGHFARPEVPGFIRERLPENFRNLPPQFVHLSQTPGMREHFGTYLNDPTDVVPSDGEEGDKFWGEGEPPGGRGKGTGDGDDPGEPGDDPADGQGGDPSDPSIVEVPEDLFNRLLAEQVELPNLRPKDGLSTDFTLRDRGVANRRSGTPSEPEMAQRAFDLGLSAIADRLRQENPDEEFDFDRLMDEVLNDVPGVMEEGRARFRPQDHFVIDQIPKRNPDINALVIVMVDFSGSMSSWWNTVKKMVSDINAILNARYKSVKFLFVPFDASAHVYDSLEEFLRVHLGGGTDYEKPFRKATEEIYPEYPSTKWDRFPVVIGDLIESKSASAVEAYEEMKKGAQYTSILHTGAEDYFGWGAFFQGEMSSDPYVGFKQIPQPSDYYPLVWREVFRNDEK